MSMAATAATASATALRTLLSRRRRRGLDGRDRAARDEEATRGMPAHEEHLPDDARGCERRRPARYPRALAAVDGERAREPGRVPPDDPRGEELALQRLPEVEELAQARVLGLHLREPIELLLEALHALAQRGVLAPRMHQVGHALPAPGHAAADGGSGALERRHELEEGVPEGVGATRCAAAPHDQRCPDHEAERHGEQDAVATDVVQSYWGPVRCSRAARAPLLRCPQTPSAGSSALALGLPPWWAPA